MTDIVTQGAGALASFSAPANDPAERLAIWLSGLNPNTRRAYEADLEALARHLGVASAGAAIMALCSCDKRVALAAVESFRQARISAGLSPAAINRPLSVINSALRHLARAQFGPGTLDVDGVKSERVKDARGPDSGDLTQVLRKLAADSGNAKSVRDIAILRLAGQRGLRRSEIAALTVGDVDISRNEIRVKRKGKSQKVTIRVADTTRRALEAWLAVRASLAAPGVDALLVTITPRPDQSGQPFSADAIYRLVKLIGGGAAAWRPHGLRHTAITTALRRTNNLEAARELAGHANIATTQMYLDDKAGLEQMAVAASETAFD